MSIDLRITNTFHIHAGRIMSKEEMKAAESVVVIEDYYLGHKFKCTNGVVYSRAVYAVELQLKINNENKIKMLSEMLESVLNECRGQFESNVLVSAQTLLDVIND